MKYYIILLVLTVLGAFASLFLKRSSNNKSISKMLKNKNVYIGALLYIASAFLNIYVLKYLDYSIVLPLTSITYIWTMFISRKYLGEKINKNKIFGLLLILLGVFFITR